MLFAADYFTYELSGGLPNSLDAKETITVPYRVTSLHSPDQSEGDGGGDGCERLAGPTTITYQYTCPAGQVFEGTSFVIFSILILQDLYPLFWIPTTFQSDLILFYNLVKLQSDQYQNLKYYLQ